MKQSGNFPLGRIRSRLGDESGLGVVEFLVTIPVTLTAMLAIFGVYNFAVKDAAGVDSRARATTEARAGLETISRDLRQANVIWANSTTLAISKCAQVGCAGTPDSITWNCAAADPTPSTSSTYSTTGMVCTRQVTAGPHAGPVVKAINNVVTTGDKPASFSPAPFAWSTSLGPPAGTPAYVTVNMPIKVKGYNNPITLKNGFYLRNIPNS